MRTPASLRGLVCLLALAGTAACTPSFDNATTVSDLRLLGVQADPPEVLIDLEAVMATGSAAHGPR